MSFTKFSGRMRNKPAGVITVGGGEYAGQEPVLLDFNLTFSAIGMIPVGTKIELSGSDFLREKKIQGSTMGSNRFRVDMPRYVDMYLSGKLKLNEMISREITLEQINDGFEALLSGEVARQVIRFEP
jgi:S-(hydroxymethyl)glutathione dehydrogenase/alcohol dehydrogenase